MLQVLSPTVLAWFALARRTRPGILVLTAILHRLSAPFALVTHGNQHRCRLFRRAVLGYRLRICRRLLYDTAFGATIAQYGTLPVVGWVCRWRPYCCLAFYAKEERALCGERRQPFLHGGDRYIADVQPVFERRSDWWPKASILNCAEPLSSALLSLLLLGISFTLPDWLGAAHSLVSDSDLPRFPSTCARCA